MTVAEAVKCTEQLFQVPYCICFLVFCFALVDICRACGILKTSERDDKLAALLKADSVLRSFILERVIDAALTELCAVGALCWLIQCSGKAESIIVMIFPSLLFIRVMGSLHSRVSHVLKENNTEEE